MFKFLGTLLLSAIIFSCTANTTPTYQVSELEYPSNLSVIRRADWGWKALQDTIPQHRIKRITIHHGGIEFKENTDVPAHIRQLQDWSRSEKHWIDIPYHFMIDLQGKIYEARPINYPGDTNTKYDPHGHALIEVMGNYEVQTLQPVQLDALIRLSAYLAKTFDVDTANICGHKDYTETLCPGKNLYRYLEDGTIRKQVAQLLKKQQASSRAD